MLNHTHQRQELNERLVTLFVVLAIIAAGSLIYYVQQGLALQNAERYFRNEFLVFQSYGEDSLPLPELRMRRLDNGKEVTIGDFQDRYVLLNLWATWCTPCLAELPAMQKLAQRYKGENLNVIAVSVESKRPPEELRAFLKRNRIGGIAYYQDVHEDFQKALIFNALPTTYLIAPDGRILYQMTGTTDWYSPRMFKFLDAALKIY